jgi:hypothetical protein
MRSCQRGEPQVSVDQTACFPIRNFAGGRMPVIATERFTEPGRVLQRVSGGNGCGGVFAIATATKPKHITFISDRATIAEQTLYGFNIAAAFTFLDPVTTATNTAGAFGKALFGIPDYEASLWNIGLQAAPRMG